MNKGEQEDTRMKTFPLSYPTLRQTCASLPNASWSSESEGGNGTKPSQTRI